MKYNREENKICKTFREELENLERVHLSSEISHIIRKLRYWEHDSLINYIRNHCENKGFQVVIHSTDQNGFIIDFSLRKIRNMFYLTSENYN